VVSLAVGCIGDKSSTWPQKPLEGGHSDTCCNHFTTDLTDCHENLSGSCTDDLPRKEKVTSRMFQQSLTNLFAHD